MQQALQGRLKGVKHWLGIKTQPEQARDHGCHHQALPHSQIREAPCARIRTVECTLHHAQSIERGSENAEAGYHRNWDADFIGSQQYEKLSDEIADPGQTKRSHAEEQYRSTQPRRHGPKTAHAFKVASMNSLL